MRERPSARLLVVDEAERVLLFHFLPQRGPAAGQGFWATPGGAVDPGETFEQAACRELLEETGFRIADPGPQVHHRKEAFLLADGETVLADERYFLIRVDNAQPSNELWTELERQVMTGHRWWSEAELRQTDERVWPKNLADLLHAQKI
jgi:8-oxo-dGTP diphosphatase